MAKPGNDRRKELMAQYRERKTDAGVVATMSPDGRFCLVTSGDVDALCRRERFQLELGGHPCKALQQAWNQANGEGFDIMPVKTLKPKERDRMELKDDLSDLREQVEQELIAQGKQPY